MSDPTIYFKEDSPKAEILQAALDEFVQYGKKGARMQAIADKAGVNKAMLHYYFSSKENLHQEVIQRVINHAFSEISATIEANKEPKEQVRALIGTYYDFIAAFPELPHLILHEINSNPVEIASLFSHIIIGDNQAPQTILHVIRQGTEQKQFREVDPRQFLITILSSVIFFFVGKPLLTRVLGIEDEEAFIRQRKQHVLDVLLTSLERK